jgi:2-phosphosulfolactate phosphatase
MIQVRIFQGHKPDLPRADVNIVIDVIRAFTTTHVAFSRGARQMTLLNTVDKAFAFKAAQGNVVLAGEINALPIEGFDLSNSPYEMNTANVRGKHLVLKTTNGVEALLNAFASAEFVYACGFVNARKTAQMALKRLGETKSINIIASHPTGDDDLACALYIKSLILNGAGPTREEVRKRILASSNAEKFLDPLKPEYRVEDLKFCTEDSDSETLVRAARDGERIYLELEQ